jgi:hypothetical protein
LIRSIFQSNLFGLDVAAEAVAIAKMRLWLLSIELGAFDFSFPTLLPLPNLEKANALEQLADRRQSPQLRLINEAEVADRYAPGSVRHKGRLFDICVGNPPYIALSQKSSINAKMELIEDWNRRNSAYTLRPTVDVSNLFILRSLELLTHNGVLAFITSRNFFDTRYGDPIRRYLTREVDLRSVLTLHDHPFTNQGTKVKANTVILCAVKRPPRDKVGFTHLSSWTDSLQSSDREHVDRESLHRSRNWTATLFAHPLQSELSRRCVHRLGEYALVKMGTKSGCNRFFILPEDSPDCQELESIPNAVVPVAKNSRASRGFVLARETQYRLLNLHEPVQGVEQGYSEDYLANPLARYIYERGIKYPCHACQSNAQWENRIHPERFPHAGMCLICQECLTHGECDRPVDRLSTGGHAPAWYTLSLDRPPLIAVQCIVDTDIGVFLNQDGVFVTDQFQVIDVPHDPNLGWLLFLFLNSRVSHLLLEGTGLHRARYDGSFMLKLQVEHLKELPCPAFEVLSDEQKSKLAKCFSQLTLLQDRRTSVAESLRDELDDVFLDVLGFDVQQRTQVGLRLRESLKEAILFRWTKTRARNGRGQTLNTRGD